MSDYPITWITQNLAAGRAPMSYADLDSIKERGIVAIVNLCGEFSDLHELEEQAGFEVFWIPIPDETAPSLAEMEKGLDWLDEALYLGKKVLVHCRHGIGRTGTFITAYLLRRGFNLKKAGKVLKSTSANPTNFSQWWLLRKYGKQEGALKHGEPSPENRQGKDLSRFYERYEQLLAKVDTLMGSNSPVPFSTRCCSSHEHKNCQHSFSLELIEALYLNNKVNVTLTASQRQAAIAKARAEKQTEIKVNSDSGFPIANNEDIQNTEACPLQDGDSCLLHQFRPIHCRLINCEGTSEAEKEIKAELKQLSHDVFETLFGVKTLEALPSVSYRDSISGKFIQSYFQFLMTKKKNA